MSSSVLAAQTAGIATAYLAAGGITALSLFDVPMWQSLPASRSLPQIRWLFSRGSHIYPSLGILSSATFAYLTYGILPRDPASVAEFGRILISGGKSSAYLMAALVCFTMGPWTSIVMVPTNFKLMDINADKGGYRSSDSAQVAKKKGANAESDTVNGGRNTGELTDLSGPQSKTSQDSTPAEDREVRELLTTFQWMNYVRAVMMATGGTLALVAAITS